MKVKERNLRDSERFRNFNILRVDEVIKRSRESRKRLMETVIKLEKVIDKRYGGKEWKRYLNLVKEKRK